MENVLNIISAITAILAALFWFISAKVSAPKYLGVEYLRTIQGAILYLGNPILKKGDHLLANDIIINKEFPQKINELLNSIKMQSNFSAIAAIFAGSSALCQFTVILIKQYFIK